MEQAPTDCPITADNYWFQKPAQDSIVQTGLSSTIVIPPAGAIWMLTISVPGLSLLGFKRIRGLLSISRYINPSIIIIINLNFRMDCNCKALAPCCILSTSICLLVVGGKPEYPQENHDNKWLGQQPTYISHNILVKLFSP